MSSSWGPLQARLIQSRIVPPGLRCENPVYLVLLFLRHRIKRHNAAALHGVEPQGFTREIQVVNDFVAAVDALGDDAGKGLAEKARAVKGEPQSIEERLHDGGYLERIVRRCKNDSVRGHHFLDEHIPIVLQRTVLLAFLEAHLTAYAGLEPIVAQADDFVFYIAY